jgi:YidC/Oxa1 family membrane protein insertase
MPQQPPPPSRSNWILFFLLFFLIYVAWTDLRQRLWPPPKAEQQAGPAATKPEKAGERAATPPSSIKVPSPPPPTPEKRLLSLGSNKGDSTYHLGVQLDPRGGGVRRIVLNKFQAADGMGQPEWMDAEHKLPRPLTLVSSSTDEPSTSFLLYNYDVRDPADDKPLDTLGRVDWKVLGGGVEEEVVNGNRKQQRVRFQAEAQGVLITKTFTLTEGDYHLGLEVKLERAGKGPQGDFRYQLTGAHGLPVEGKWFTNIFRNAMVARGEHGTVERNLQDLRQISVWDGGNEVRKEPGLPLRYFGVAVQYFASVIAVDNDQPKQDFLAYARPTLELAVAKGVVQSIAGDRSSLVLLTTERHEETFQVLERDRAKFASVKAGDRVAVIFRGASFNEKARAYPQVAVESRNEETTHALWVNDITVRASTDPVELKPGQAVTHKYVLYNGPVKVSQLYSGEGVAPAVVDRYIDRLRLDTLTDYHSPGWLGSFANTIGFSWLVIKCTNLMHIVLGLIHTVVRSYGLCIILMTVLVRGLMFPVSRKQQLMSLRMQKLAPELKKLQEKYKDDRQAMGMAQMELYRKHGVNPFGTCWFLLLQMPIFMGLYFALQESIHFRLAEFWPTWITNLAAPDMLFYWGQKIPWISRPQDYGGFLYLGPFFNLLPLIAVVLMLWQQKMMTPPPTDDQQAMQMKVMRFMMIFMGLFFYKVAAGLCIYFIASSAWGFAERKLLPRLTVAGQAAAQGAPVPPATTAGGAGSVADRGRRDRGRGRVRRDEAITNGAGSGPLQRLRQWWQNILEEARKK